MFSQDFSKPRSSSLDVCYENLIVTNFAKFTRKQLQSLFYGFIGRLIWREIIYSVKKTAFFGSIIRVILHAQKTFCDEKRRYQDARKHLRWRALLQ